MKAKRFIPPATRHALAEQAIGLAGPVETWAKFLQKAAADQDNSILSDDPPVVLKHRDVRTLINAMWQQTNKIRELEKSYSPKSN